MSHDFSGVDWQTARYDDKEFAPGDPYEVARLGKRIADTAKLIEEQAGRLDNLVDGHGWDSDAGRAFQEKTRDTVGLLTKTHQRYAAAASALGSTVPYEPIADTVRENWATALNHAQNMVRTALKKAQAADADGSRYQKQIDQHPGPDEHPDKQKLKLQKDAADERRFPASAAAGSPATTGTGRRPDRPGHEESKDRVVNEDEASVDELFAQLPEDGRRALKEVGMELPELRRMAAGAGGMRQVRGILSEFTANSHPRRPGDDESPARRSAVWPWIRLLLVAVAAVAICLVSTYVITTAALFVGAALAVPVLWAMFRTRLSRGGLAVRCLVGAAYVVLVWLGSQSADQWYLQVRGEETTVAYAEPDRSESHGEQVVDCRVTLPDGSVRQVVRNDSRCADKDAVGSKAAAVIDPSGHYRPVLGDKSDIGGTVEGYVCLGAAAVLVLAPVTAAVLVRRHRRDQVIGASA
ncbi:hypothetical protein [Streptomyces sp. NPDC006668]|uniref:hypothetical protein n=1 Tax=Streptomyces sp. NPDC006668 TaxID=3156903 RepID=UPI0033CC7453